MYYINNIFSEAEMKRMKEQNERFKQEMKQRAEEARKKKIEEKAKEKERQKEQKKIVAELLAEWKRPRDDLECDDLKELPKTLPVHCRIPNKLFGDFLTLLEFFHSFSNILECEDTFSEGITFELLEKALTDTDTPRGALFELLKFMLQALFDLQQVSKKHALKKYDQFALNTSCFLGKYWIKYTSVVQFHEIYVTK